MENFDGIIFVEDRVDDAISDEYTGRHESSDHRVLAHDEGRCFEVRGQLLDDA